MNKFSTLMRWATLAMLSCFFSITTFASTTDECSEEVVFSLYCPDDVTVSCTDELWDLSIYGNATYHDYTGWHDAGYPTVHWNLNSCNTGTITRTWTVEDYNWVLHSCTQTITVSSGYGAFGYDDITWPTEHVNLEGCYPNTHPSQLPYEAGYPTYNYTECSSIGISYSDQVFTISSTCKKIVRKWQVMDWCQYNPNTWPYGSTTGLWTYYQFIKISQGDVPDVYCPGDIEVSSYNCKDGLLQVDPLEVDASSCGGYYTITNNSPYAYSNGADISGVYPLGYTNVKYTIEFGCGKRKFCTTKVYVKDNKAPTVYCFAEIAIALMAVDEDGDGIPEDGMVEIWAKDLDKGSTAACNGGPLKYSFSEDPNDGVRFFTCDEVGNNEVRMYVTDTKGRQAYCLVNISVQNNGANIPDCEPTVDDDDDTTYQGKYSIGGTVMVDADLPYEQAMVTLKDMTPIISYVVTVDTTIETTVDSFQNWSGAWLWYTSIDSVFTETVDTLVTHTTVEAYSNEEGKWMFEDIAEGAESYELSSWVTESAKYEGIDKNDLDFLLEVLLEDKSFTSLAQAIAADINQDRKVNFDDLKLLLDYVSGEDSEVLDYDWVVIDENEANQEAVDEALASYQTTFEMDVDSADHIDIALKAIKIGDLVDEEVTSAVAQLPIEEIDNVLHGRSASLTDREIARELQTALEATSTAPQNYVRTSPNPFLDVVTINYQDLAAGSITIQITDANGRLMYTQNHTTVIGENNVQIDMNETSYQGLLLYRLVDGEQVFTGKLLRL